MSRTLKERAFLTSVNWNPADPERSFCNLRPGFPACNERGLVALSVERSASSGIICGKEARLNEKRFRDLPTER